MIFTSAKYPFTAAPASSSGIPPRRLLDGVPLTDAVAALRGEKTYELANHLGNVLAVDVAAKVFKDGRNPKTGEAI
jgi:hypothetical protein